MNVDGAPSSLSAAEMKEVSPGPSGSHPEQDRAHSKLSEDSGLNNQGPPPPCTVVKPIVKDSRPILSTRLTKSISNPELSASMKAVESQLRRSISEENLQAKVANSKPSADSGLNNQGKHPAPNRVTFCENVNVVEFIENDDHDENNADPGKVPIGEGNNQDKTEVQSHYPKKYLPNMSTVFGKLPTKIFLRINKYVKSRFWEQDEEFWNGIAEFVKPTLKEGEKVPFTKEQLGYLFYIIWVFGKESWSFPWKH